MVFLPVWPTEKYRQNGTHLHYRRKLSSSIPIDDLARLPGNPEVSGLISRELWILKIDGGEGGIRTPDSLATMSDFESGAFNRALPPLRVHPVYPECGVGIKWCRGVVRGDRVDHGVAGVVEEARTQRGL